MPPVAHVIARHIRLHDAHYSINSSHKAQINVMAGGIESRGNRDSFAQHTPVDPSERCPMLSRNLTIVSAILGAAALLTTPAFAAKESKKKVAAPKAHVSHAQRSPDGVYAWDGRYLGADPDPNIRFQLMRDQNQPPD
jgi:hypothetical protein